MMKFGAVLFDLDNTLANTTESFWKFLPDLAEYFLKEVTRTSLDELFAFFFAYENLLIREREKKIAWLKKKLPFKEDPSADEMWQYVTDFFPLSIEPVDGAFDLLEYLKEREIPMGVVTNGSKDFQSKKIVHLGLMKFMKTIVISEDVGFQKPDSKIFHIALSRLKTKPEETIFIGDHPKNDYEGAFNAGLYPVWIKGENQWSFPFKVPEISIRKLNEVVGLITEGLKA